MRKTRVYKLIIEGVQRIKKSFVWLQITFIKGVVSSVSAGSPSGGVSILAPARRLAVVVLLTVPMIAPLVSVD